MKFRVKHYPENRFKVSNGIPMQYIKHIKAFAKPTVMHSGCIDIIYQERRSANCRVRYLVFIVKESVDLEWKIARPKMSFQTIEGTNQKCIFSSGDTVEYLTSNIYLVLFNTDYHCFILDPGIHVLTSLEFSKDAFNDYLAYDGLSRDIVENYYGGSSRYFAGKSLSLTARDSINEVLNKPVETQFHEQAFGLKLKLILTNLLEQQAILI